MENLFSEVLEKNLLKQEKILWTGRPESRKLFAKNDLILFPISIWWGISVLDWVINSTIIDIRFIEKNGVISSGSVISFFLGLLLIFSALYMLIGRIIIRKHVKERTLYAVTDKRILIFKVGTHEKVIKKYINEVNKVDISISESGIGIITFGEISLYNKVYGDTWLKSPAIFAGEIPPIFFDIYDAKNVYELVNSLRNKM